MSSTIRRTVFLLSLCVLAVGGGFHLWSSDAGGPPPAERDGDRETARLESSVEDLRAELAELRQRPAEVIVREAPAAKEPSATEDPSSEEVGGAGERSGDDARREDPTDDVVQAQVDLLEGQVAIEERDVEWSPWAEAELGKMFQREELAGAELATAECAATLCKLELSFTGVEERDRALRSFFHATPWHGQGATVIPGSDAKEATIYLARASHSLPVVSR